MIQANELRIGNWVDGGWNTHIPYQIKESDFNNTDFTIIKPILLTPEILEKAGFEESGFYVYKGDVRLYSLHSDFTVDEGFIFDYGMVKSFVNVKHLHQLQNLYFAWTGEELQIDL